MAEERDHWFETVECITCGESLEVPVEHLRDGPFKHDDCPPPVEGVR